MRRRSNRSLYNVDNSAQGKLKRTIDGILFASEGEALRYIELKYLEQVGEIRKLRLKPKFTLEINGWFICKYTADFGYIEKSEIYAGWNLLETIEEFKGKWTREFKRTWPLVNALFEDKHFFIVTGNPIANKKRTTKAQKQFEGRANLKRLELE